MATREPAVVLLSGGLDSATSSAIALSHGFDLYAITFQYGQRHATEINAAQRIASSLNVVRHEIVNLDLRTFGGSALTADLNIPTGRTFEEMSAQIPITYVPARNTIFLSLALAFAETVGAFDIFVGMNALDYDGYPDCRPEYISAFEAMSNLATKSAIETSRRFRIHAPLIALSKSQIIEVGLRLGLDYSMTSSCYSPSPDGVACGRCDACQLRLAGFAHLGLTDPIQYMNQ